MEVIEVGVHERRTYAVLELIDGGSLLEWIAHGERSTKEILGVYLQAARGLSAAHARGLVHRDFKPSNVMIGKDGRVRVGDFGLVSRLDPRSGPDTAWETLTRPGQQMGTPAYMSPEQLMGEELDARSDQFSFCVSLFEALYGNRPWTGTTSERLRASLFSEEIKIPESNRDLPSDLRGAIVKGLGTLRGDRHESMLGLVRAIEAATTLLGAG
jgi:serine/threonine protein kinase